MLRRRFGGCQAIKQYTPCIHGLRDRNPVEIVLAEQSTAVLIQEGVSLKHRKASEGHTNPPEPTRRGQIVNSTKLGRALEVSGRSSPSDAGFCGPPPAR